jgi:hypothetical protein
MNHQSEYEPADGSSPMRQGDVLEPLRGNGPIRALVVITADCDLTHNKYGSFLTSVPIVEVPTYIHDFWADRLAEKMCEKISAAIRDRLREAVLKSPLNVPMPSDDRLVTWPQEASCLEVSRSLGLDEAELTSVFELAGHLLKVESASKSEWTDQLASIARAMVAVGEARSEEKALTILAKRISTELPRQLPGDALYLGSVSASMTAGYVALARYPVAVPPDYVALSPADVTYGEVAYRRVSRLASPFRFRLTQMFAEVFASIGLPEWYEDERAARFDDLATSLIKKVET